MHMKSWLLPSGAIAIVTGALIGSTPATADAVCGPGRMLGPGPNWICVKDTRQPASPGVPQPTPIGQLAASLWAHAVTTDDLGPIPIDDPAGGIYNSRASNRAAMLAAQEGKLLKAQLNFKLAASYAKAAGNQDEYDINIRNAQLVGALRHLREGYEHEQRGEIGLARASYESARTLTVTLPPLPARGGGGSPGVGSGLPADLPPPPRQSDITGVGGGGGDDLGGVLVDVQPEGSMEDLSGLQQQILDLAN
jgi:hypothetical protein